MSFLFNNPVLNNDAFGRLRVSEPYTLGDYKHLYGVNPDFINYNVGGGSIAFQTNQSCIRLSTSTGTTDRAVHQTAYYHHYMPGKSQVILQSFNFYTAVTNVTKRTGYFDDNNGIFFEQTGAGTLNIVLRSYTSGAPVDTRIAQSSWNTDKCDGTGTSGYNMDITKTQLFFVDFQWLGVGKIRAGFVHQGVYIVAHTFSGTNNLTNVYMTNPNLPVRCEILNTGASAGGYFDQICSSVMSEGGYQEAGLDWAVTNPSLRTIASGASLPVMAIRLKTSFQSNANRMTVRVGNINVFSNGANMVWHLYKLPNQAALTGSTWVSVDSASGVEYNATATAVSTFTELDNGYISAGGNGSNRTGSPTPNASSTSKKNYIVQNYDSSDSQIYVLYVTNIDNTSGTVGVGVQWREIY